MAGLTTTGNTVRPLRTVPNSQKNEEYHYKFAAWCLNAINSDQHRYFQAKSIINWNFHFGNQWIFEDDLETFMMDESNDTRNRIKFVENTIRPFVNQLVGKVIQTDFSAKAIASSSRAVSRMEEQLSRLLYLQNLYTQQRDPRRREMIKQKAPIGDSPEETFDRFKRFYRDEYTAAINSLIEDISDQNQIEAVKVQVAKHLAVTGLGVVKTYEMNGMHMVEDIDPMFFLFDPGAKKPDLSDASFWGEYGNDDPAYLLERFPNIPSEWRKALDGSGQNHSIGGGSFQQVWDVFGVPMGRVPRYEIYWRDGEYQTYGYVIDEFGYYLFTRLDLEGGKYSVSDAVIPEDEDLKKKMKGKLTKKVFKQVLRYCVFCPSEYVTFKNPNHRNVPALVLDYGVVPYAETYLNDFSNVAPPYKCHAWDYQNGYIQAPVDDAISPQRFLNRMLSMVEAQVNNSRGSGTIYDKDMIDEKDGEQELLRSMNLSKPVGVHAKGNLNNSVSSYDLTVRDGTINLFNVINNLRASLDNSTGRNIAMRGQQGGKRESVGVSEDMQQTGQTMQEPFFFAIAQIMLACVKSMANQGKKIYIDNKRKLSINVGEGMGKLITLTKDMEFEDFKIYIKRSLPDDQSRMYAKADLKELRQLGLVDEEGMAKWYSRATLDDISTVIQESFNRKVEMSKIAADRVEKAEQQQLQAVGQEQNRQEEMAAAAADVQRKQQVEDLAIKGDQGLQKLQVRENLRGNPAAQPVQ